ncbi:MAG: carboxymuconolactone decarboxylase family protein [Gammaproteobacteria bacterium]|nr:carboxymuconolactone decarboxylase family protein [Gammaproteobacteria bacterium]
MPVTKLEKELAAIGISVAAGCKPCTNYHLKAARKAGASGQEITQAVSQAFVVRKSATAIMEEFALARLNAIQSPVNTRNSASETDRIRELVSVGAAFAVNCVSSLEHHLARARSVGVTEEEIAEIVELAAFIKQRASSHVERLFETATEDEQAMI